MISSRFALFTLSILTIAVLILAACGAGGAATAPEKQASQTQEVPVEGGGSYTDINAAGPAGG
jgi:ABC-type phosphate transport system substrate-binding protein